ncbi:molybdopterin-binding protein [Mucilaginibacter boryungensis]|uniref:Molybdopterin-binding protein n=1 Tax=Mucilaginibacter boryungensis TaxID=768480 RepID=A0ABR9XHX6_9SPHI|nr:molybdopterin-binding protein [Mucilaginibacter boryungensis]MBE9666993.1 molybdopterin-binding protein [Mucilaginibacter boryungensis]
MKKLLFILMLLSATTFAQEKVKQTYQFSITGKVKKESVITMDSLKQYPIKNLGDIKVTDHLGNFKHQDEQLKGILLKDILSHTTYAVASPKLLSTVYFVCSGSDGYRVVYSWNELYNTSVGDNVFIIMEKNGVKIDKMPESIQMTSYTDYKTGRRYLHNLNKIVISVAE